jgi:hypothetical protein
VVVEGRHGQVRHRVQERDVAGAAVGGPHHPVAGLAERSLPGPDGSRGLLGVLDLPGHGQDRADGQDVGPAAGAWSPHLDLHGAADGLPRTGLALFERLVGVGLGLVIRVRRAAILVSEHRTVPSFDEG